MATGLHVQGSHKRSAFSQTPVCLRLLLCVTWMSSLAYLMHSALPLGNIACTLRQHVVVFRVVLGSIRYKHSACPQSRLDFVK